MGKQRFRRSAPDWFGPVHVSAESAETFRALQPKLRGRRRYYRKLRRDAERFNPAISGWHDLAHWHVDSRGYGNESWRARRAHLEVLFCRFRRLLEHLDGRTEPYQCWVLVSAVDSSQDALYLHTPNPNADNFPAAFGAGVTWDAEVPQCLSEFVAEDSWQVGRSNAGDTMFLVRPRRLPN